MDAVAAGHPFGFNGAPTPAEASQKPRAPRDWLTLLRWAFHPRITARNSCCTTVRSNRRAARRFATGPFSGRSAVSVTRPTVRSPRPSPNLTSAFLRAFSTPPRLRVEVTASPSAAAVHRRPPPVLAACRQRGSSAIAAQDASCPTSVAPLFAVTALARARPTRRTQALGRKGKTGIAASRNWCRTRGG